MDTTSKNRETLQIMRLGLADYAAVDALQRTIQTQRQQERAPDSVLLLEHPNVITLGKRGSMQEVLADSEALKQKGVQVISTDRGGQNTVHAPGQLVGYLLIHLYREQRALRKFITDVEQVLIDTLLEFGVKARTHPSHVGVWTEEGKIASIGVSVNYGVTRHGFALNVNTALDVFNFIVPCGIKGVRMVRMKDILKKEVPMREVEDVFVSKFTTLRKYARVKEIESPLHGQDKK